MGFVILSFLVAFLSLVFRVKAIEATGAIATCNDCEYDLAGLPDDAACPECGSLVRKPATPARSEVAFKLDRVGFQVAALAAWGLVALAHGQLAHDIVLRSMVRAGFNAHAASVWVSRNSADNVVFDSANAKTLGAIALVSAAVTPWLAVVPRRFVWFAGLGMLMIGAAAIGLAYARI